MTQIEQLIEKKASKYVSRAATEELNWLSYDDTITTDEAESIIEIASEQAFVDGANFALSQFKWRKVEEELPEAVIEEYSSPVLIKTKYGVYYVAKYNWTYKDFIANSISILEVTHWMPIPEVE